MALYIFSLHILSVCFEHINLRFKISPRPLSVCLSVCLSRDMYVRFTSYTVRVVSFNLARGPVTIAVQLASFFEKLRTSFVKP
jgi:hypothetical protein